MATAPLPTPDDIKNAPTVIKIPNTLIMDKDGSMAREWLYFFNDIGQAIDQQITANLPELTQKLLDTVADTLQLGSDADAIRADIATVQGTVADNSTAISNNASTISGLGTDIISLQSADTDQNLLIDALTIRVNDADALIATLVTRITALETAP